MCKDKAQVPYTMHKGNAHMFYVVVKDKAQVLYIMYKGSLSNVQGCFYTM